MHRKIRILLFGILIVSSVSTLTSQTRTSSPFSRYGLGDINHSGFGRNNSMGGTGIGIRTSQHLNNLNPASYSAIDSLSFFFETGVNNKTQIMKFGGASESFPDFNFDYFALGFRLNGKTALSVGLKPMTSVGYEFEVLNASEVAPSRQKAMGTGNVTNLYGGVSYKINNSLSTGVHASFLFGNLKHTSFSEFTSDINALVYGLQRTQSLSSLSFDFGAQYSTKTSNDNNLVVGAIFRPKLGLNGKSTSMLATGYANDYDIDGNLFRKNAVLSEQELDWKNGLFELPTKLGVGLSYLIDNKLTLAADYSTELWQEANFPDNTTKTANTNFISMGMEYTPNARTATKYYQIVRYRAGFHYHEDYIMINDNQLLNYGMSFGLGLPLNSSNSSINLGFEYGNIGTGQSGSLTETYRKFSLSFTMHEYWFIKRKFD